MNPRSSFQDNFTWEGVPLLEYKPQGNTFQDVTRQILFDGDPALPAQWRYFEVGAGGHSTLERHAHLHVVMILRGRGQVLLGERIEEVRTFDVLRIGSKVWHQFRATRGEPLGFLCLVNVERDKPQLPGAEDLKQLRANASVAEFIRV